MKFTIVNNSGLNIKTLMRKIGYREHQGAFVRLLGREFYPRFHIYVDFSKENFIFKLHLDQKKASYSGYTAHSGEYENEILKQEKERIEQIIKNLT